MLTLDLTNAPQWCDLIPGVRVKLRPLTTALMVSAPLSSRTRSPPVKSRWSLGTSKVACCPNAVWLGVAIRTEPWATTR